MYLRQVNTKEANELTYFTQEEIAVFSRIFLYVFNNKEIELTDIDKEIAYNALKRVSTQRQDWSEEQKAYYHQLLEIGKNIE